MEYQKIINLLDNTPTNNQSTKFRTKNWAEINDESTILTIIVKLNLKLQC